MVDPALDEDGQLFLLVPHPSRPGVALTTVDPVALPTASYHGDGHLLVEPVTTAVAARLGSASPPILRLIPISWTTTGKPARLLVDLEPLSPAAPEGLAWTALDEPTVDALEPLEVIAPVRRWVDRQSAGAPASDAPWSRPGWRARCGAWMTARMDELGSPAVDSPQIHYLWSLSMVLRAPTEHGRMFLKCSAPIFGHEAAVTDHLARVTPNLVTRVAAVEPTEGWLLMHDLGSAVLGDAPLDRWAAGLETHVQIQRAWSGRTAELLGVGAADRSLRDLAEAIPVLEERSHLGSILADDDRVAWRAAVPDFVAACRRLDALGPTPTLVHGDLHPWNIADEPTGPRIFDWTDAAVSHPFTDLAVYVTRTPDLRIRRSLRDAYLAGWADVLDPVALAEAGDLALVVGALYQVDSYFRITESLGPDDLWDLGEAAGSWVKAAVATLREGIDVRLPGHADG